MKVLVIQQKMIGDVLTSSILFEAIKNKYPEAELHYLINSSTSPVVEGHPIIDKFIFFTPEHEKSTLKLLSLAKALRKEKYDVVIDVYSKFSSAIISLFSGAKIKISKHKWYTSFVYTDKFNDAKVPKTNAGLAVENRLQFLKALDISVETPIKPKIYLSKTEKKEAVKFFSENGLDLNKPLFMIGVLGSGQSKTYPHEYMAQVIDFIAKEKPEAQILFNYIPNQKEDAKAIFELCKASTQKQIHFNVFGKNLRRFIAITSHCNALIGNEGGAVNMAKALQIPTFTIFSPWIRKEAWNMFDDGKKSVSVHLNDYKPELFTDKQTKELKAEYTLLYNVFTPSYFTEKLSNFLK